jgi:hypothetical protein
MVLRRFFVVKIEQKKWTENENWDTYGSLEGLQAHLVLAFGERNLLTNPKVFQNLKNFYPDAQILTASTSGNIIEQSVEDTCVATAIAFEKPHRLEICKTNIKEFANSYKAGLFLGEKIPHKDLSHVFLLSDGHLVNGSSLVTGLLSTLPSHVAVTGGLAGDGTRFEKTLVGAGEPPKEGEIVIVGFYGSHLKFGFGSVGGWDPFGIERTITKSKGNVLLEIDGQPALDLYKKYLGDQAEQLPGSALLFPLSIRPNRLAPSLVRTILSINENEKSMIFAGDVPEGWSAQLMKANFDRLVDGAHQAASDSYQALGLKNADIAILISCVGRRIVLGPRTEEEIESVHDVVGNKATMCGFYSYGEIAPTCPTAGCELHNQTMTITVISEV